MAVASASPACTRRLCRRALPMRGMRPCMSAPPASPACVARVIHPVQRTHTCTHGGRPRRAHSTAAAAFQDLFRGIISGLEPAVEDDGLEPELMEWLQAQGVTTQPLLLKDCGEQGRGLVTASRIRRGSRLLLVPRRALLTAGVAAAESALSPLLANSPLDEWTLLAAFLAELRAERSAQQQAAQQQAAGRGDVGTAPAAVPGGDNDASPSANAPGSPCAASLMRPRMSPGLARWGAYVDALPAPPANVVGWPRGEAAKLLSGTSLASKADTLLSAADASWADLQPLVAGAEARGLLPRGALTRRDFDWAVGLLLSRVVRLDGLGGALALVPWADCLNHDVGCGACLDWDGQAGGVALVADRDYEPGEQVYVSYGPKSSGELLLSYGFCPPPADNPNSAVHMVVGPAATDPLRSAKAAALAARGLPASTEFPLRIDGFPETALPLLAFAACRPADADEVAELAAWLFDRGEMPVLDGVDTQQTALEELRRRCAAMLAGMAGSEAGDAAAAARMGGDAGRPPRTAAEARDVRTALCAALRQRERQILRRCEFIATSQLREMRKKQ